MKKIIIICILFFSFSVFAIRTAKIDSLIQVTTSKTTDKDKIAAFIKLSWDYRKYSLDSALMFGQQGMKLAKKNEIIEAQASCHTNIGVVYWFKGNMDSCKYHFYNAYKYRVELNDSAQIGSTLMNIGNLFYANAQFDSALFYQLKSIDITKRLLPEKDLIKNYNNIALIYSELGNFAKSLEYNLMSLKIAENEKDSAAMSFSYNNIGNLYFTLKQYKVSLDYQYKSLQIKKNSDNKLEIAYTLSNIANAYQELNLLDSALYFNQQALKYRIELKDTVTLAHSYNNIGLLYKALKDYKTAIEYQQKALAIRLKVKDENALTESYLNLGTCYFFMGEYMKAIDYYNKAKQLSEKTGVVLWQKEAHKGLHEAHYYKGNYKIAYDYFLTFFQLHDSLFSEQQTELIAEMQTKYESEKQQQQILILNKENELKSSEISKHEEISKRKTIQLYSFAGGFVLIIIILIVIYRNSVKMKKLNNELKYKNEEISLQKDALHEKNIEIMDSITYAQRIQQAILPPDKLVKQYLQNSFILYKPKDIVAGDFFWMEVVDFDSAQSTNNDSAQSTIYYAAADCTGHGVPGAMVSVVCHNSLNRAVREFGLRDTGKILDKTRELVIETFEKSEEDVKDGMDISLCALNTETNELSFSGANNPLYIISDDIAYYQSFETGKELIQNNKILTVFEADKQPIGKFENSTPFTTKKIRLKKGDTVYVFSDGYADQFGGEKGKKFKASQFKELLLSIQEETMENQRKIIDQAFENWKGNLEQIDDVCIIGVRL
jgi:tetratricopeptide (TPR) repeat protein